MIGFGGTVDEVGPDQGGETATPPPMSGIPPKRSRRSPTTRRSSAGAGGMSTRCASGRRARPTRCASMPSTGRPCGRAVGAGAGRSDFPGAVPERGQRRPAQELRLRQEYFFASASLQDLVYRHMHQHGDLRTLAEHAAIQLNDTHPAIAVPELMRLLVDVHDISLGRGLEDHRRDVFLYQPHAAAGGAGDAGR